MRISTLLAAAALTPLGPAAQDIYFPDDRDRVEIPLTVVDRGDWGIELHVAVDIAGVPATFLFDTGANLAIDPGFAERLRVEARTKVFVMGIAAADLPPAYRLRSFRLGAIEYENHLLAGVDLDVEHSGIHGILGNELLGTAVIEVDVAAGRMVLHEPAHYEKPPAAVEVPLTPALSAPTVPVGVLGRRPAACLLDTGNSSAFLLHAPHVVRHGLLDDRDDLVEQQMSGVFRTFTVWLGRLRELSLGGLTVTDVPVELPDPGAARGMVGAPGQIGNVGLALLSHFRFTLHGTARVMYLEPSGSRDRDGESTTRVAFRDAFGLCLDSDGEDVVIGEVIEGSPAAAAELRSGDVLVALDGQPVGADMTRFARALRARDRVRIACRRDGATSTVELARREYLKPIEPVTGRDEHRRAGGGRDERERREKREKTR